MSALRPNTPLLEVAPASEAEKEVNLANRYVGAMAASKGWEELRKRFVERIDGFKTGSYIPHKDKMTDEELGRAFRVETMVAEQLEGILAWVESCREQKDAEDEAEKR